MFSPTNLTSSDALTDKPERFFVSEIIRENITKLPKEIPYSVEVVIEMV